MVTFILLSYYDLSVHTCISGQKLSGNSVEKRAQLKEEIVHFHWGKYPEVSKPVGYSQPGQHPLVIVSALVVFPG